MLDASSSEHAVPAEVAHEQEAQNPFAVATENVKQENPVEPLPQPTAEEVKTQEEQMKKIQRIFAEAKQQQGEDQPESDPTEAPEPLSPMQQAQPLSKPPITTDSIKNFFAQLQLGKIGEGIKKAAQIPGKIISAMGRGFMKFWTAGDVRVKN